MTEITVTLRQILDAEPCYDPRDKMHRTILDKEREIERLTRIEENYNALLDSSLEHSKAIIGNVLKACEAAAKENK